MSVPFSKPLQCYSDYSVSSHVRTLWSVWDGGSGLSHSSVFKVLGMLLRVRFMHVNLMGMLRNPSAMPLGPLLHDLLSTFWGSTSHRFSQKVGALISLLCCVLSQGHPNLGPGNRRTREVAIAMGEYALETTASQIRVGSSFSHDFRCSRAPLLPCHHHLRIFWGLGQKRRETRKNGPFSLLSLSIKESLSFCWAGSGGFSWTLSMSCSYFQFSDCHESSQQTPSGTSGRRTFSAGSVVLQILVSFPSHLPSFFQLPHAFFPVFIAAFSGRDEVAYARSIFMRLFCFARIPPNSAWQLVN